MSNSHEPADFEPIADLARSVTEEDLIRHQPPSELWDKISNGVREADASRTVLDLTDTATQSTTGVQGLPLDDSRGSPRVLALAAAIIVAVVVGVSAFAIFLSGPDANPNTVYTATISNDDLPEPFDGSASVTLEIDDEPMIEIDFDSEIPSEGLVELWIVRADRGDVVSVGFVEPGDTAWPWPTGFSPAEYPVIALSVEPDDGDPAPSGRTFLLGELMTDS